MTKRSANHPRKPSGTLFGTAPSPRRDSARKGRQTELYADEELSSAHSSQLSASDGLLAISDIAYRLSVSRGVARHLVQSGQISGAKIGGQWRVAEGAFTAFLIDKLARTASGKRPVVETGISSPDVVPKQTNSTMRRKRT